MQAAMLKPDQSQLAHDLAGGGTNDQSYGFAYTAASQLSQRTASNDNYNWIAPDADIAYTRNGLNQYTSVDGTAFDYDDRGNLISSGARAYCYDLENRLTAADASDCAASPDVALRYDPLGRLRETVGAATTQFLYDGDALVGEYATSGQLLRRYIHGPGVDEPIAWIEGAHIVDVRALIADRQGSVIATQSSGGARLYRYGPYGEPDAWTDGATELSRFRYTGQIALPEVLLYHYKARVYDPALGRFLQTDPVGYEDDLNLYQYVGNDPLNRTDPTGRESASFAVGDYDPLHTTPEETERMLEQGPAVGEAALGVASAIPAVRGANFVFRVARFAIRMNQVRQRLRGWEERPNRKGDGSRFQDPENEGNRVRVDRGNPDHELPSQQEDHVVEQQNGRIVDREGSPIEPTQEQPRPSRTEEAHQPLDDWIRRNPPQD